MNCVGKRLRLKKHTLAMNAAWTQSALNVVAPARINSSWKRVTPSALFATGRFCLKTATNAAYAEKTRSARTASAIARTMMNDCLR